jgi:class 3 adenylate cyclase
LEQLIGRLLAAAEASLAKGDLEPARATAEEVRAVSPDDRRAAEILERVARLERAPGGERALMSVLFADLVDSTALAERVEPEVMRDVLAAYREAASRAVERFDGHVLQWLGDRVLAVFGYARVFEDDARRAVLAALDLVGSAARSDGPGRIGVETEVRAGVHTGLVVVAEVGGVTTPRERDSVVGAAPNLAARIQGEAAPGTVVISDVTQQLVDADFYLRSLGLHTLKGIARAVELFGVEGPRHPGARFDSDRYRRAPLVGRDRPRTRLAEAWDMVAASVGGPPTAGQAMLATGEPGIGKSRLVADIRGHALRSRGESLETGCLAYHANISLWPVARMMERILDGGGDKPADLLPRLIKHLKSHRMDVTEAAVAGAACRDKQAGRVSRPRARARRAPRSDSGATGRLARQAAGTATPAPHIRGSALGGPNDP